MDDFFSLVSKIKKTFLRPVVSSTQKGKSCYFYYKICYYHCILWTFDDRTNYYKLASWMYIIKFPRQVPLAQVRMCNLSYQK